MSGFQNTETSHFPRQSQSLRNSKDDIHLKKQKENGDIL